MNTIFTLYALSLACAMGGMELFSSLLLVGVVALVLTQKCRPLQITKVPHFYPIVIFVAVAAVSILLGEASFSEKRYDLGRMRFFVHYFVLFWILERYQPLTERWEKPMRVLLWIVGIYCLFQHFIPLDLLRPEGKKAIYYALPEEKIGPLVVGPFNHHLTFANVYMLYVALWLALGSFPKWDFKKLGLAALLGLGCVWTSSRAAWVALPVVVTLILARKNFKVAAAVVASLLLVGALAWRFDPVLRGKWDRTFSESESDNMTPRRRLWELQLSLFKEHPLLGVGWNNNERKCSEYFDRAYPNAAYKFCGHAHSNILQILATTGLLGLLAYLYLWGQIFWQLAQAAKRWGTETLEGALSMGCLAALIGFHLQGVTQWNFGDAEVLHNLMFLLALSSVLIVRARARKVA